MRECTTTTDRPGAGHDGRSAAPPARSVTARVLARLGPAMCEVLLLLALYGLYELARSLVHGNVATAEHRGRAILDWEQSWHVAVEHSLNIALGHVFALAVIAGYLYAALHYVVTPLVLIWMYRRHREHYRPARKALVLATVIGLVGFISVPTAPPRLLPGAGYQDTLAQVHHWGWWGGEGSVPRGLGGLSDQVAAMPSLHVGWALWCGVLLFLYASRRWVRWLGVAYPIVISVVVMATANHYLLDVVAGCLVMVLGALAVPAVDRLVRWISAAVLRREAESIRSLNARTARGQDVRRETGPGRTAPSSDARSPHARQRR